MPHLLLLLLAGPPEADPIEAVLRATVRLTGGSSSGTGWFVAVPSAKDPKKTETVLVTAAHVFDSFPGEKANAVLRVKSKDSYTRKDTAFDIRKGGKALWTKHPEQDIAVMRFDLPAGVDIAPLPYDRIADAKWAEDKKIRAGDEVVVACYPLGFEGNAAGWAVLRKGSIASHPITPLASAKTFLLDYTNFGGDSGSAVTAVRDKKPLVVAMVLATVRNTLKTTTPFEERTVHAPLGLAIAVQAPLVRQTVEQWRGKK